MEYLSKKVISYLDETMANNAFNTWEDSEDVVSEDERKLMEQRFKLPPLRAVT